MPRLPKPTAQLKAEGGYREDRHGRRCDDSAAFGLLVKPDDLTPDAESAWDVIVDNCNPRILKAPDALLLTGVVENWSEWRYWSRSGRDGTEDRYKACTMAAACWKHFVNGCKELGIVGPISRTRLVIEADTEEDALDTRDR